MTNALYLVVSYNRFSISSSSPPIPLCTQDKTLNLRVTVRTALLPKEGDHCLQPPKYKGQVFSQHLREGPLAPNHDLGINW